MGMVHCDVKMANVLVEERDGVHGGILTDFDLSKDDKSRRAEASMLAQSMSASVGGPRGTLGALTMAPEVMQGATPDAASDCWSFGGLVLASLYKDEACHWESAPMLDKWDSNGIPVLSHMQDPDQGKQLLLSLLHKQTEKRMSSSQAVAHGFFNINVQVLKTLEALDKQRADLGQREAQHARHVEDHRKQQQEAQAVYTSAWQQLQADKAAVDKRLKDESNKLKAQEDKVRKAESGNAQMLDEIKKQQKALERECADRKRELDRKQAEVKAKKEEADKKKRDSEAKLKEEEKKLQQLAQKLSAQEKQVALREAKTRMPSWYTNANGFHLVDVKFVKDIVQTFLRDSAHGGCKPGTANAKVVSVQRIENEHLWCMYHAKKHSIEAALKGKSIPSLASDTQQPHMPNAADLSAASNEFYL